MENEEDGYRNICIDHRMKCGLSIRVDLDDIDCEDECGGHTTCPLNPKKE